MDNAEELVDSTIQPALLDAHVWSSTTISSYYYYHNWYQEHKISSTLFLIPQTQNVPDTTTGPYY